MSVSYLSSFDLRRITWGITLTPTSGGTPVTLTSASFAKPCHIHGPAGVSAWDIAGDSANQIGDDPDNLLKFGELVFGTTAEFYANALAAAWTDPTVLDFAFDMATLRYTISRSSGDTFALSFTGQGAALFGFAGSSAAATTHTGTRTPLFAIRAAGAGLAADSGDQRAGGRSRRSRSDSGAVWNALRRKSSTVLREWVQRFEPPALVWSEFATSDAPWTYEALIDNALLGLPFCVRDTRVSRQGLYLMQSGVDEYKPVPASEGNHVQLNVPFKCEKIGTRAT